MRSTCLRKSKPSPLLSCAPSMSPGMSAMDMVRKSCGAVRCARDKYHKRTYHVKHFYSHTPACTSTVLFYPTPQTHTNSTSHNTHLHPLTHTHRVLNDTDIGMQCGKRIWRNLGPCIAHGSQQRTLSSLHNNIWDMEVE